MSQLRQLQEARFLALWGCWRRVGLPTLEVLQVLSQEAASPELRALAAAGATAVAAGDPLAGVLEAHGEHLSYWVAVLLAADPTPTQLADAAELQQAWAVRSQPALVWRTLRLLAELPAAPPGEVLGAVAREAREGAWTELSEGLHSAARACRRGAGLRQALAEASFRGPEGRALQTLAAEGLELDAVLEAVEALARVAAPPQAQAETEPPVNLEALAQEASKRAAPLRRGLERMLSGLEERLGLERRASAQDLAREAVAARTAPATPEPAAPSQPSAAPVSQPGPPPAPAPSAASARKTIGPDSGPVNVDGLAAAQWGHDYEQALAKMALLEVQPAETAIARELEVDLRDLDSRLRAGHSPERRERLDALRARFEAWSELHDESV